jgi:hypothetical protein
MKAQAVAAPLIPSAIGKRLLSCDAMTHQWCRAMKAMASCAEND